jgi:hypothetical protein
MRHKRAHLDQCNPALPLALGHAGEKLPHLPFTFLRR